MPNETLKIEVGINLMMRKTQLIGFALMVVMFLASCGGSDDQKAEKSEFAYDQVSESPESDIQVDNNETEEDIQVDNNETEEVQEEAIEEVAKNDDCDEFLKGYEKFMDKYIAIIKKQKANPTDMSIMSEYSSLMTEASEWTTKIPDCTDAKFSTKLQKIQTKMAKAISGM